MSLRTCAFTGHRAVKLPWRYNEKDPRCLDLKKRIYDVAEALYTAYGVRKYICGMAEGCDMYFCEAVMQLREDHPEITVEAAIPCEGQASHWSQNEKDRYYKLVSLCNYKTLVSHEYSDTCMARRNKYMVCNASVLITVFDGKTGGTMQTVNYAKSQGLEIIEIMP